MTLIDELKEKREAASVAIEGARLLIDFEQNVIERQEQIIADLDLAIAALTPFPTDAELYQVDLDIAIAREPEAIPDEQPELFEDEKVEALEQLETDHALPPSADDVVVEEAPETVEEAPALNEAMQDEREEGYAPVTNPEADFWAQTLTEQPKPEPFRLASIFRREKEEA
jgi:hypothetical protein